MKKLPNEASNRLMNILYSKTAPKVAPTTSTLTRTLYENTTLDQPTTATTTYSDLISQPLQLESQDLLDRYKPISNILQFNCYNSYISKQDFLRVYPTNSRFKELFTVGKVPLEVVKSRNPQDLSFNQAYYLVFPSKLLACIYLYETSTKMLNGVHLNFKFANLNQENLSNMSSTLINPKYSTLLDKASGCEDDNYEILQQLISRDERSKYVRIQNLPFNLKPGTIQKLLWDYNLPNSKVIPITKDLTNETNISLIKFNHIMDAQRFVRNFHGKKWDRINKKDPEIQFFEPILCEIVD
ncbi:hypothetical protein JA1_003955 [Spathaspora sp. JA1]|nr:hypothetical protein JA1_003955 [Spathaspora sp. JA1]